MVDVQSKAEMSCQQDSHVGAESEGFADNGNTRSMRLKMGHHRCLVVPASGVETVSDGQ
jgi:hypothetical protein